MSPEASFMLYKVIEVFCKLSLYVFVWDLSETENF